MSWLFSCLCMCTLYNCVACLLVIQPHGCQNLINDFIMLKTGSHKCWHCVTYQWLAGMLWHDIRAWQTDVRCYWTIHKTARVVNGTSWSVIQEQMPSMPLCLACSSVHYVPEANCTQSKWNHSLKTNWLQQSKYIKRNSHRETPSLNNALESDYNKVSQCTETMTCHVLFNALRITRSSAGADKHERRV